jgi:SAM-dependent methyltransferase
MGNTCRIERERLMSYSLRIRSRFPRSIQPLVRCRSHALNGYSQPRVVSVLDRNYVDNNNSQIAHEPELIPPLALLRQEGIEVLEDWFRWGEEWSMLLRIYGGITKNSTILEIGCGLGQVAFPLRYILSSDGAYEGFDTCNDKIAFLEETFHHAYPNFCFLWTNVHNTYYNPHGRMRAVDYRFPYLDSTFDLIYAASAFTHMLPEATEHYFQEASRCLKPEGRCLFSFFLLENYRSGQPRPLGFARPIFNFDYRYGPYGQDFATMARNNPEQMTAYNSRLIERFAKQAGLQLLQAPVPGFWSGSTATWVGAQDLVILGKQSS